ncbi:erythromycin esterase family protein [Rhodanobacter sp. AS-Z3]|uniref:erythromycin esterase family protein n=1 Tax=Rhodanobacter sp. AS-Z3 TaxID=3031330 RepID=UPI00247B1A46|nr:erythromycin esterase family protein [Rhodanobacter sp. AS-Z3]WEN16203.1 erythromycin esterase family protein [Rhodanobacter sp. AS-Z3]
MSHAAGDASSELDRAIHALCSKQVVLLGEDGSHAGATTIAVKAQLVRRLVQECGFGGVVFESQFYDMLAFDHAVVAGLAQHKQLADGIGALWSHYAAFAPLEDWLFAEAAAGRLRVGGMDPQAGGSDGRYSADQLPVVLSSVLAGDRRMECDLIIGRHDRWEYDEVHPFDGAALPSLRACIRDIREKLAASHGGPSSALSAMANSYANYLDFAADDPQGLRDRGMYQNLMWLRKQWPAGTRIVVWCASVHAAKTLAGSNTPVRPLGSYVSEALGNHAAAIGFSALGGSYGHVGGRGLPRMLAPASPGSLESRTFATTGPRSLRFVDHKQLQALGRVSARALEYGHSETLDWSTLLDGVIVLREETPATVMPQR